MVYFKRRILVKLNKMKGLIYMRKIVRVMVLFTAAAAAFTTVCTQVYAVGEPSVIPGDNAQVNEAEYYEYYSSLSDEQKKIAEEKEYLLSHMTEENPKTRELIGYSLPGSFTMYQQETDTYCGPACVKSALMYINGSSPSQTVINLSIHQDFTKVPNYMNGKQNRCLYIYKSSPTETDLVNCIKMDVVNDSVPAFLRIVSNESNWKYATPGHCILAKGVITSNAGSYIEIADPWGGKDANVDCFYTIASSVVDRVCRSIVY